MLLIKFDNVIFFISLPKTIDRIESTIATVCMKKHYPPDIQHFNNKLNNHDYFYFYLQRTCM